MFSFKVGLSQNLPIHSYLKTNFFFLQAQNYVLFGKKLDNNYICVEASKQGGFYGFVRTEEHVE